MQSQYLPVAVRDVINESVPNQIAGTR